MSRWPCATSCASRARRTSTPAPRAAMAFLNAKDPATIKLMRAGMIDFGYKAQRLGYQPGQNPGPDPARSSSAAAGHAGQAADQDPGDPLHQQAHAGRPAQAKPRAPCSDIEDATVVPVIRDPQKPARMPKRCSTSPAAARNACSRQVGLATQAMLYAGRRHTVLPPGYLCCGYPQTVGRRPRQGAADHHRQPGAVPPRGQHPELSGHQDRDRVLRHLHGPAAEIPVREDLPRLPPARHPRIPDGKGREAGRRGRHALHVPRPLPHADEDLLPAQGGQQPDGQRR